MSGNGQAPLRSAWLWPTRTRLSPNMSLFYQRIGTNSNTAANSIWTSWFFGSSGGSTYSKTVTATVTTTATILKSVSKTLLATVASAPAAIKTVSKKLLASCSASVIGSAILAAGSITYLTLTATCVTGVNLKRITGKILLATVTTAASVIKSISKKLLAICTTSLNVLAHKCILYTQAVLAVCTTLGFVSATKVVAGAVASLASALRIYKPQTAPVIPGSEVKYLQEELLKVSNAFKAHVEATKSLDARLTAAGF